MKSFLLNKGFTLIELLIVIAVIGVLSVGVLTALNVTSQLGKANLSKAKTFSASVENALAINQVGKWSFEEGSGTLAKDTSGYGNNGNLINGGYSWQDINGCGSGFGGCISFDGTNGYVDAGNNPSLSFGLGSFTISAWVYTNETTTYKTIISKGASNSGATAIYYMRVEQDKVLVSIADGTSAVNLISNKKVAATKNWHHLVMVVDRNSQLMKIYIDGTLDNSISISSVTGSIDSSTSLRIGTLGAIGWPYIGYIDEVAIYSQALLSSQIQQLYAQGLPRHILAIK